MKDLFGNTVNDNGDSFAQYPVSLAEVKGEGAHEWTPRDVLISMLRKIDRGEINPNAMIVVYHEEEEGATVYSVSSPGTTRSVGMLECAKHCILNNSYEA